MVAPRRIPGFRQMTDEERDQLMADDRRFQSSASEHAAFELNEDDVWWFMKKAGITETPSEQNWNEGLQLKTVCRKAMTKYHPDKTGGDPSKTIVFAPFVAIFDYYVKKFPARIGIEALMDKLEVLHYRTVSLEHRFRGMVF